MKVIGENRFKIGQKIRTWHGQIGVVELVRCKKMNDAYYVQYKIDWRGINHRGKDLTIRRWHNEGDLQPNSLVQRFLGN